MIGSLCLLLLALSIVLWRDRDFWFPSAPEAETAPQVETPPVAKLAAPQPPPATAHRAKAAKPKHRVAAQQAAPEDVQPPAPQVPPQADNAAATDAPPAGATVTNRTVLPALEVEVVAGDKHRTIRPGSNSVRVDLQPSAPPEPANAASTAADSETAASVTSEAAEHVQMSATTSDAVAVPVRPNYPLLARQMKVQGSVILQALISKDGVIQNLRVVSGPRILASAAQDAVRQWHFKPHYEGSEAVETQAKITVNFTISTN
jgi:protein TonB